MIIKRLSASFGKLSNETLCLSGGLNIIEAPNECGKSTWCSFIRAMFYGIRTADRDKLGYLSDKTRFRPWNGAAMSGSMDIDTGGVSITIERLSSGKLPMKDFSAVYTGTGTPVGNLYPDSAGETLLGVSEAVFERSALISQSGIKIGQTPELEKRISALVSTGDETSSYTEADEKLRLWLRKRRYNKSGSIPELEEKLDAVSKKLSDIESSQSDTTDMRLEIEKLKKQQADLQTELKACDAYEARLAQRHAQEKLHQAQAGYNAVYAELAKLGPVLSDSDIAAIRGDLKSLGPLKKMMTGEEQRLQEARSKYAMLNSVKKSSPFAETAAGEAAARAEALERKTSQLSLKSPISLSLILLLAAAAALAVLLSAVQLYAGAAALILLLILLIRVIRAGNSKKQLNSYLSGFGAGSVDALKKLCADDDRLTGELAAADSDVRATEKTASSAAAAYEAVLQNFHTRLRAASLTSDVELVEIELLRIEALKDKLSAAKSEITAAESFLKAVEEAAAPETKGLPDDQAPARGRQEIASDLNASAARLNQLEGRYNMMLGEICAMGDPAILSTEKRLYAAELSNQKTQFDALTMALEALRDASVELQTRFSPLLSETAGRIVSQLTAGRYEKLTFDKSLDVFAKTADETVSRNILALSAGTADQIYLALRLAVVELLLSGPEPCPLILDDALSNFDDRRALLALDYLKDLAAHRQVLLFTCHGREAAYLEGTGGVNIIRLK